MLKYNKIALTKVDQSKHITSSMSSHQCWVQSRQRPLRWQELCGSQRSRQTATGDSSKELSMEQSDATDSVANQERFSRGQTMPPSSADNVKLFILRDHNKASKVAFQLLSRGYCTWSDIRLTALEHKICYLLWLQGGMAVVYFWPLTYVTKTAIHGYAHIYAGTYTCLWVYFSKCKILGFEGYARAGVSANV